MAARVMGIYTSREGVALTMLTGAGGKKLLHATWNPAFLQPDGTPLYPAEEIHKQVQSLSPDVVCLFDTALPAFPFPMTLPRMRAREMAQALKIELESRNVTDIMDPVVGFCRGTVEKVRGRRAALKGFGLAVERSELQTLRQKYRPLGIDPDLMTLPIYALSLAFIQEGSESSAVIFLMDGDLVMMTRIHGREIRSLEVFYGGEDALAERITALPEEEAEVKIYGFEAVSRDTRSPFPQFQGGEVFREQTRDARLLVQRRQPVSRMALAASLARIPFLLGSLDLGGIHAVEAAPEAEKGSRKALGMAVGLIALVLLGTGAALGVLSGVDSHVYTSQKAAIRRAIASVLRSVPPLAGTEVIESKILEYQRIGRHLNPMLAPSTLSLPIRVLPVLDKVGGITVTDIFSSSGQMRVAFTSARPLDKKKLKDRLKKSGVAHVRIKAGSSGAYELRVGQAEPEREARAE